MSEKTGMIVIAITGCMSMALLGWVFIRIMINTVKCSNQKMKVKEKDAD